MSIFQPKIHSLTKELINVQLMKRLGRIKYVLKVLNFRWVFTHFAFSSEKTRMKGILLQIRQTGSTELSDSDLENIDAIERKLGILSKKIIEVIVKKDKTNLTFILTLNKLHRAASCLRAKVRINELTRDHSWRPGSSTFWKVSFLFSSHISQFPIVSMDQIDKFYVKLFISFKYNQRKSHDYKTNRIKNRKIHNFLKIIYV